MKAPSPGLRTIEALRRERAEQAFEVADLGAGLVLAAQGGWLVETGSGNGPAYFSKTLFFENDGGDSLQAVFGVSFDAGSIIPRVEYEAPPIPKPLEETPCGPRPDPHRNSLFMIAAKDVHGNPDPDFRFFAMAANAREAHDLLAARMQDFDADLYAGLNLVVTRVLSVSPDLLQAPACLIAGEDMEEVGMILAPRESHDDLSIS